MKFLMSSAAIASLSLGMTMVPTTASAGGCNTSPCASGGYYDNASRYGGYGPAGYYGGGHYGGGYSNAHGYGSGNGLVGAGIGAIAGGVIGSQLAGSGARTEGSIIGAALGGAAGYSLGNATGGFAHGGGYGYGSGYGPGYGGVPYGAGLPSAPTPYGPTFVHSGQYISGPVIPVTRYSAPRVQPLPILSQPSTVYTAPVSSGLTIAAPNVSLAGPPIRSTVVRRTVSVEPAPIVRAERYTDPVMADCPAGTTPQADGTCLEPTVTRMISRPITAPPVRRPIPSYTRPVISEPYTPPQMADCPAGTTKQSDGTCLERSYTSMPATLTIPPIMVTNPASSSTYSYSSSSSYSAPAACPAGTSKQSDGTCLSHATTSYTPSYSSSSVSTSYRVPAPTTSYQVPDTVVRAQDEYCYSDSGKRYDSLGNEIKSHHSEHCRH